MSQAVINPEQANIGHELNIGSPMEMVQGNLYRAAEVVAGKAHAFGAKVLEMIPTPRALTRKEIATGLGAVAGIGAVAEGDTILKDAFGTKPAHADTRLLSTEQERQCVEEDQQEIPGVTYRVKGRGKQTSIRLQDTTLNVNCKGVVDTTFGVRLTTPKPRGKGRVPNGSQKINSETPNATTTGQVFLWVGKIRNRLRSSTDKTRTITTQVSRAGDIVERCRIVSARGGYIIKDTCSK